MKIIVINLDRRPDKWGGVKALALYYGYYDHLERYPAIDGSQWASHEDLLYSMQSAGYPTIAERALSIEKEIIASGYPEWGPVHLKSHFALRWTYFEVLSTIDAPTLVLLDDQYLPYPLATYKELSVKMKSQDVHILALDPMEESGSIATDIMCGYHGFTEEAILWTPAGAAAAKSLLLQYPHPLIGDVLRAYYPKDNISTTKLRAAKHIGQKEDWTSDVHIWTKPNEMEALQ